MEGDDTVILTPEEKDRILGDIAESKSENEKEKEEKDDD
jgi:hypothetical protein